MRARRYPKGSIPWYLYAAVALIGMLGAIWMISGIGFESPGPARFVGLLAIPASAVCGWFAHVAHQRGDR
jgi:hypothetical protein